MKDQYLSFQDKQRLVQKQKLDKYQPTKAEAFLLKKLEQLRIRAMFKKSFIQGSGIYTVDFYFPKPAKVCLDLVANHDSSGPMHDYLQKKELYLQDRGFSVIRILNTDIFRFTEKDFNTLIGKIRPEKAPKVNYPAGHKHSSADNRSKDSRDKQPDYVANQPKKRKHYDNANYNKALRMLYT